MVLLSGNLQSSNEVCVEICRSSATSVPQIPTGPASLRPRVLDLFATQKSSSGSSLTALLTLRSYPGNRFRGKASPLRRTAVMSHQGGGYPSKPSAPSAPPSWQQPSGHPPGGAYGSTPYGQPPPSSAPYAQPPPSSWHNQSYSSAPQGAASYGAYSPYGGYPPQQPYGSSYMQSPFPAGTDPEIVRAFQTADRDGSGLVDEYELQRTLSTAQPFSLRTVRLMIHLFGSKDSKKIGPNEFATLWKALKDWKSIFERFDRDRSGSVDKGEMREALMSLGYAISPPILDCLLQKYDRTGQAKAMDYDSFVECGLIVKGLTEKFKQQDTQLKGSATLDYQTFMLMVLPFVVA